LPVHDLQPLAAFSFRTQGFSFPALWDIRLNSLAFSLPPLSLNFQRTPASPADPPLVLDASHSPVLEHPIAPNFVARSPPLFTLSPYSDLWGLLVKVFCQSGLDVAYILLDLSCLRFPQNLPSLMLNPCPPIKVKTLVPSSCKRT